MKRTSGSLMLLLTALIWGTAFAAQRSGMDYMGPFLFQSVRLTLGWMALVPVVLRRRKRLGASFRFPSLKAALACGMPLAVASTIQQVGLTMVPAGKAGFITALYVVLVPVFGLFLGRRPSLRVWLGVALAVIGLYLLSGMSSLSVSWGEMLIIACAAFYALQILAIDRFAPGCDGVALSMMQFFVASLLPVPFMLVLEHPEWAQLRAGAFSVIYAGVFSCAVAYTLQILGQKRTPPVLATLIMSLESVFSVLAGAVFLGERMTGAEILGCGLMLGAVLLAQLPMGKHGSQRKTADQSQN